jgi:hypothetical protein
LVKTICAVTALFMGDPEAAVQRGEEAVASLTELGDPWSRAVASLPFGVGLLQLGDFDGARDSLKDTVPPLLEVRDLKMASACLIAQGMTARFTGNDEEAERPYAQALDLCAEAGDPANAPMCVEGIAAAVVTRDPRRAARLLGTAQALFEAGHQPNVPGFEAFYASTHDRLAEVCGANLENLLREGRREAGRLLTAGLVVEQT